MDTGSVAGGFRTMWKPELPSLTLPIVDRYIVRRMIGPLVATLLVALLLLLIERALRLLDMIFAVRGSLSGLLPMLVYLVPHYLGLALPLGLFLAVLLTFSRLHRDREMDAFQAAGFSLFRLARPILILAIAGVLIGWSVFGHIQPLGRYAYRAAAFTVKNAVAPPDVLKEGIFTKVEDATVLVEQISLDHKQFAKVFVYQESSAGTSRLITAPFAQVEDPDPTRPTIVTFLHGTDMRVPIGAANTPASAEVVRFERFTTTVGSEQTDVFRPRGHDARDLTLPELWERRLAVPGEAGDDALAAEFHGRLVRIASIGILPFFALPFALGGRRRQHPHRVALGVLALIAYNELLQVGEALVAAGNAQPVLALWLPWLAVTLISLVLFVYLAHWPSIRPPSGRVRPFTTLARDLP